LSIYHLNDVKNKILKASKWAFLSEIASKAVTPLVFVILARILSPEDYGIMNLAAMVIAFAQIFYDGGLGKALIQRQSDTEEVANIVFWTNVALGLVFYLVIFFLSPFLAVFFKDYRLINVLRVQSLVIIIYSFSSVQTALLQKKLDFKSLFWVRIATSFLPGCASIPLALVGYKYWALVVGIIIGGIAQVIILWMLSPWKPKFYFNIKLVKPVYRFGFFVTLEAILTWGFIWGDSLIVGKYLGTEAVGLYRTGNYFVSTIYGFLLSPLLPILYSTFSILQTDRKNLIDFYLKTVKTLSFVALPIAFGLFSINATIGAAVFGGKWIGIGPVIGFFAILHGTSWIVGMNPDLYRAVGKPQISTIISSISLPIYFIVYLISVKYGLVSFLSGRLILGLLMLPVHLLVAKKMLSISMISVINSIKWFVLSALLMTTILLIIHPLVRFSFKPVTSMAIFLVVGCFIYSTVYLKESEFLKNLFFIIIKKKKD